MAVLAIDPSSSFSGGAILGDRIRMNHHCTDEGVFIRNKSDDHRSEEVVNGLNMLVKTTGSDSSLRHPPIIQTIATENKGIDDLRDALSAHKHYLHKSGKLDLIRAQLDHLFFKMILKDLVAQKIYQQIELLPLFQNLLKNFQDRYEGPYSAAGKIVDHIFDWDFWRTKPTWN